MKEEAIQQLALEMEDLQEQHRDIIAKVSELAWCEYRGWYNQLKIDKFGEV